jgi:hypothetical protein
VLGESSKNEEELLLEVEAGVELTAHGPYRTKYERDSAAKQIRRDQREDDSLFWADINGAGTLTVGTYTAGFFWQESSSMRLSE